MTRVHWTVPSAPQAPLGCTQRLRSGALQQWSACTATGVSRRQPHCEPYSCPSSRALVNAIAANSAIHTCRAQLSNFRKPHGAPANSAIQPFQAWNSRLQACQHVKACWVGGLKRTLWSARRSARQRAAAASAAQGRTQSSANKNAPRQAQCALQQTQAKALRLRATTRACA